MSKTICFNETNAAHIYEWLLGSWRSEDFRQCAECEMLATRLEKFIGAAEARRIRKVVKAGPY